MARTSTGQSGIGRLKLLQELRRCHDAGVPKCAKGQEMPPVPGDKKVSLRSGDTIKDAVIEGVAGDAARDGRWVNYCCNCR